MSHRVRMASEHGFIRVCFETHIIRTYFHQYFASAKTACNKKNSKWKCKTNKRVFVFVHWKDLRDESYSPTDLLTKKQGLRSNILKMPRDSNQQHFCSIFVLKVDICWCKSPSHKTLKFIVLKYLLIHQNFI